MSILAVMAMGYAAGGLFLFFGIGLLLMNSFGLSLRLSRDAWIPADSGT